MKKERILSGMRSTGKLHLGNYHGALKNWIKLQDEYECFFFVADWHGLTTEYADPKILKEATDDVILDWLAFGLDPKKSTIFIQSRAKEHAELFLLLSMITPLGWLERVPSYKEMRQELKDKDLSTYGFLGYPVLQSADIVLYNAQRVPVGIDQVPHIELTREIVRRFNSLYGNILIEPQPLLTEAPKLLGLDRRKMSKSFDNCIYLSDPPKAVEKKIKSAITDPARMRREDPGNPEICVIFDYHKLHSPSDTVAMVKKECPRAGIGCVECKEILIKNINGFLAPYQKRRGELEKDPEKVRKTIDNGCETASKVAAKTMREIRTAMALP